MSHFYTFGQIKELEVRFVIFLKSWVKLNMVLMIIAFIPNTGLVTKITHNKSKF